MIALMITALVNIVPVVCLTYLSVYFNKWWIVLFSLLFYQSLTLRRDKKNENI